MATKKRKLVSKVGAATVMVVCAGGASAIELEFDNGWSGSINSDVTVSASWRMQEQDKSLTMAGNIASMRTGLLPVSFAPTSADVAMSMTTGAAVLGGRTTWTNAYAQAKSEGYTSQGFKNSIGNLNYDKGDMYSSMAKIYSELNLSKGDMGIKVSAKAWYDYSQNQSKVKVGSVETGYVGNAPLQDSGALPLARFDGIEFLDTYGYAGFDAGGSAVQVRLGKQAINWGESLFFQGVNQLSPLDVTSLRRAGAEIKEALLPVWSALGSIGLPGGVSMDAFYQFKWEPTVLESCGTFWGGASNIAPNPGACNTFTVALPSGIAAGPTHLGGAAWVKTTSFQSVKPKNSGQWGVALRFPVAVIDTEFGIYAENIHSRLPVVGVNLISNATKTVFVPGVSGSSTTWDYLSNIKIYGISAATTQLGVSWGAELSYQKDVPVALNADDYDQIIIPVSAIAIGVGTPLNGMVKSLVGSPDNTHFTAANRFNKWQLQLNGIALSKSLAEIFGALSSTIVGEVMFQGNNIDSFDPKTPGQIRYGGSGGSVGNFTTASGTFVNACTKHYDSAGSLLFPGGAELATGAYAEFCKGEHYVTDYAWGYKLRAQLEYADVLAGFTAYPSVFFAHDVKGVSMDGQLQEDRRTISAGLRLNRGKVHDVNISYTAYYGKWNALRDRDNLGVSYKYSF